MPLDSCCSLATVADLVESKGLVEPERGCSEGLDGPGSELDPGDLRSDRVEISSWGLGVTSSTADKRVSYIQYE